MKYTKPRIYKKISRYGVYRLIMTDNSTVYTETVNQTPIEESENDIYHEVLTEEENRLDIIANKYYGSPEYYWIIAIGNNLIDPMFIKPGTILRIPSFVSTTKWGGPLYSRL